MIIENNSYHAGVIWNVICITGDCPGHSGAGNLTDDNNNGDDEDSDD